MSGASYEFGQVDRFQVGAVGEPGERTFYLFIVSGGLPRWFKCEKGQAAALGEQSIELLTTLGWEIDQEAISASMAGSPELPPPGPGDVLFRVGSIAMRIDRRDLLTFVLGDDEEDQEAVFMITAEQLKVMAVMALEAVHSGREQCPNCLLPEDPGGHDCPAGNGHRLPG